MNCEIAKIVIFGLFRQSLEVSQVMVWQLQFKNDTGLYSAPFLFFNIFQFV